MYVALFTHKCWEVRNGNWCDDGHKPVWSFQQPLGRYRNANWKLQKNHKHHDNSRSLWIIQPPIPQATGIIIINDTKGKEIPGAYRYIVWLSYRRIMFIFFIVCCFTYLGVSKNRGTPKWMVYNRKPYKNGWFGGTTIFGNIHLEIHWQFGTLWNKINISVPPPQNTKNHGLFPRIFLST